MLPRPSARLSARLTAHVRQARQRHSAGGGHADFYASLLPAMVPVALLGSAVYMGLHLLQSRLAHEKFLDEARERIRTLEQEVDALHSSQAPSSKKSAWWHAKSLRYTSS